MKDYETLVRDIIQEENELKDRVINLEYFMMTEDYQKISERQKLLLNRQLEAMRMYKGALIARVMQARFEHSQKPGDTCESELEKEDRIEPHVFEAMMYEAHKKKEEEPQEIVQPSDCVNCRWGERTIKNERITCVCRNPDKTISRDKCFEARKY